MSEFSALSADARASALSLRMEEIRARGYEREGLFDRASLRRDERSVELSFSSEQPVERWFGLEVLSHDPGAANLSRLNNGANLLINHDPGDWVGVIEAARIDPDRRGRARVRFGNSARAEEIWRDVQDGILRSVSFGYRIDDVKLVREGRSNGPDEYLVTRFTPFEISLVTTPADATVGVGRSIDPTAASPAATLKGANMAEQQSGGSPATESAHNLAREYVTSEATIRQQAMRDMAKRNADMRALGEKFARWGGRDLAAKAVEDAAITFDQFREQLLSLVETRQTQSDAISQVPANPADIGAPAQNGTYGMGARDMIASANLQTFRGIGKVLHKSDHEVAYRAGMWARAVIFGDPSAHRWCRDAGVQMQQGELAPVATRTMTEGIFTSAGWLVPVEMESAIISNREQYGVARRICNVIPMGTSTMTIPRVTSDITAYFVGEGTSGTASDSGGDQVQLNLKDLMAYTKIGKSTAMDAVIPLAEMVAREQARAFAIKEDACLIIGDGTSTYGGMQGINTLLETAAYAGGRAAAATNHDTFGEIDASDVAGLIGKLPVFARPGARFVVSGVGEAMIFGRLKLTAGGQDTQTLQGGVLEQSYAGFPISVAHNMPAGATTDYSTKVMALLGNFQLGVAFGSGSGMMLTVDPYTLADQNLTRVITTERIDIVAHGVNKSTTVAGPICCLYGD